MLSQLKSVSWEQKMCKCQDGRVGWGSGGVEMERQNEKRQRGKERDWKKDRQTPRQTDTQTDRHPHRQTD